MPGTEFDPQTYANMQTGKPYASYRKTILGKVYVNVLDPFNNQPTGFIIAGRPDSEEAIYDVFSEMEDVYFKRSNRKHFDMGELIKFERPTVEVVKEKTIEQYSDEELKEVINFPYMKLRKYIDGTEVEAVLFRMIDLAREMEKSEKIIRLLEGRLSEIQLNKITEKE
jgi:hypothetical protein